MAVFKENLTSKILQENSLSILNKYFKNKIDILEIGCGNGNITKFLISNQLKKNFYHLSDISKEAVEVAKKNIKYDNVNYKVGSYFNPWKRKFDLIISDVSSISDFVAKKSDWYKGVVCNSGTDGLENITKILNSVDKYLNSNGVFILPIISLCNEKKLISLLKNNFKKVTFSKKILWPLSNFFQKNFEEYEKLRKEKKINFIKKFSINIAYTYSAICKK
jgi:methylase of polypeptide subunit release factors